METNIMKTEDKDARTIAPQRPILFTGTKTGQHLFLRSTDTIACCGKQIEDDYGTWGGDERNCKCKKCLKRFWEKHSGYFAGAYDVSLWLSAKYRKTFRFCDKKPFVEEIRFKDLRQGDVFYMEEAGELFVPFKDDDCFLLVVIDCPEVVGVNTKFKPTNWCVKTLTLTEFWKNYKIAIDVGSWEQLFAKQLFTTDDDGTKVEVVWKEE
jgi:hypothetical protein